MIITKYIEAKITPKTFKYFQDLGYNSNSGDLIIIPIEHLNKGSKLRIEVKCDICEIQKHLTYKDYNKSLKTHNFYTCSSKCGREKFKLTCLEKYGFENVSQTTDVKKKVKNTNIEKYRVDNVMLVPEFNEKMKNSQKEIIKDNGDNITKTRKQTMLNLYGVENPSKYEEFKLKTKGTNLTKFGVDNASKSKEIKEKKKNTTLKNFGVDNPLKSDLVKEKVKITKIKNGNQIPDNTLSLWEKYKKEVRIITNKNKKKLFESWDGNDYYDKEFIRNNLSDFKYHEKSYPTIDHKISLIYGFLNEIPPKEIGDISNLCITKKSINSSKREKIEKEFNL